MSTEKHDEAQDRSNANTGKEQSTSGAEYDKLMQEAEEDAPRTAKPGSSGGNTSDQDNNGRGGGK